MEVKISLSTYALSKYLTTVSKNEHGNYRVKVDNKILQINGQDNGIQFSHIGDNLITSTVVPESTIKILKIIIDSISDRIIVLSIGDGLRIIGLDL